MIVESLKKKVIFRAIGVDINGRGRTLVVEQWGLIIEPQNAIGHRSLLRYFNQIWKVIKCLVTDEGDNISGTWGPSWGTVN